MTASPDQPRLRVLHGGEPSAEELAALVVTVAAVSRRRAAAGGTDPGAGRELRESALRRHIEPGPDAWRASARPGAGRSSPLHCRGGPSGA